MFFKLRMANSLLLKNLRISKNLIENEKELNKILTSTLVDLKQESRKLQTNSLELLSLYNEESEMINI
jgi:DNA-binding PucR family transcriptional regulator